MKKLSIKVKLSLLVVLLVFISSSMSFYNIIAYSTPINNYQKIINKTGKAQSLLIEARNIVDHDFYDTLSNLNDYDQRHTFFEQINLIQEQLNSLISGAVTADEVMAIENLSSIVETFLDHCRSVLYTQGSMKEKLSHYKKVTQVFEILNGNLTDYMQLQIQQMKNSSAHINRMTSRLWLISISAGVIVIFFSGVVGITYVNKLSEEIQRELTAKQRAANYATYLANHDSLTHLPNRLKIEDFLKNAIHNSPSTAFTILYIDLDGFKAVNDNFGHEYGDAVLVAVADVLRRSARISDKVARLGGDEFVVALMTSERRIALQIAERIIEGICVPIPYKEANLKVSASIGVASYPNDGETLKALLDEADKAMYKAKKSGKNTFHLSSVSAAANS